MKQKFIAPPYWSDQARLACAKAIADGDVIYANAIRNGSTNRMPTSAQAHAEFARNSLQHEGDVFGVSHPHHSATAAALNEFKQLTNIRNFCRDKFKALRAAFWTR